MKLRFTGLMMMLFCCYNAGAQIIQDPTTWTYEAKKTAPNTYQLIFHLQLKTPWHIWSLKPGGDGYQMIPEFVFAKNAAVTPVGKIIEKGKLITGTMEGIDGKVNYFSGSVDYTQMVTVKGKTDITGEHTYQVCNDKVCLPPKTKKFSITIQ